MSENNNKKYLPHIVCVVAAIIIGFVCWEKGVFDSINATQNSSATAEESKTSSDSVDKADQSTADDSIATHEEGGQAQDSSSGVAETQKDGTKKASAASEESAQITESLNKKSGKVIVSFKDGSTVVESEINDEINKLPEQLSEKMSLKEIRLFLSIRAAFDHIITAEAKKEKIDKDPEVLTEIKKRQDTVAGMMLLNDKAQALMTDQALEDHYNKVWDENFKGTKEFSLTVITTADKSLAEKICNTVKDEPALRQFIDANKVNLKVMELDNRSEAALPPEILGPVKEKGANALIGPFPVRDTFMVFFVKSVADAKKHEFSGRFKEEYKKIALKDFMKKVNFEQYKRYKVRFLGLDGKEIDIEKQSELTKNRAVDKEPPSDQFNIGSLTDETVLAYIGNTPVTAKEIRLFFKLKSLQDEAFIMMAQQFNMSLSEILIYATKLVVDDKLLTTDAQSENYDKKPEVREKLAELKIVEISKAYLKKHVTVTPEVIRTTYNSFIQSIPEEDKNDHEISMKMVFFATKEAAGEALTSINSGKTKFNEVFKSHESDKSAIDFKYVTKKTVDPTTWSILKRAAAGTCYKDIVEIDGSKFGIADMKYAIIYVGDRRPVTLPSLSNPGDKKYFEALAYQKEATSFVTNLFAKNINSIFSQPIKDVIADPVFTKMMEAMVAGTR